MADPTRRAPSAPGSGAGSGRRELLQTLPLPLAQLLRRAMNGKSAAERHHGAFYLAECTLKIASAARVGLWLDRALVPGGDLARKLEALVLPSLGHWCELLRELTLSLSKRPDVALLPPLCDAAALARKRPEWTHVAALGRRGVEVEIFGEEPAKQASRRGVLGFFDLVVAYRNVVIGHGAQRTSAFYEELAHLLLDAVVEVLADPALLGGLELAQARREVSVEPDGETSRTTWYALTGLAGLPRGDDAGDAIPGHLYLIGPGARVPLHPLLVYRQEDELGREQVGFLNKAARRRADREGAAGAVQRAEYLDYASGQTLDDVDARAALTALLARLEGRPVTPGDVDAKALATRAEAGPGPDPGDDAAEAGATIGDFELLGELGRGSMGVVYKARQRSLGRIVALKVLPPALVADRVALKRFKNEMLALARCDHPNVVRILATGSDGANDHYAMEYVDGKDLAHAASVPVDRLAELFAGAADGLAHLHENGILHRDIKPGNLMLTADGKRVVIMDLGLAKLADESQALTSADVKILGTLRYMAPEQLQRRLVHVDARVDVYGLGAALYELATGRPIHDGETEVRLIQQVLNEEPMPPRRANPVLHRDFAAVIQAATAKLPAQRYASAAAFADDLRAVARDQPIRARPPGLASQAARWARGHRSALTGLGVALLAIAAGGVALWDHSRLKVGYYESFVDKWGGFEGVGELAGPEGRYFTFKVLRRGGRVVAVECVNGRGAVAACGGDYASAEFHYAEDGAIAHRIARGPTGKFLVKYGYTYQGQKLQILRQDRNDLPLPELGDVAMYRFDLDAQGFRRKVTYFNDRGSPRRSFGAYGYEQTNDAHGEPTALVFLDADGSPLVRSDGVARATITWFATGREASRAFFGVDGKPVNTSVAAGIRHAVDAHGNEIERVYLGVDGQPALQSEGIALWRARYDEHGCMVEKRFFGPDERPTLNKLGFASMLSKCDEHGREIERAHFGAAGEPVVIREGFSIYRSRYDARGNEVERSFFGADAKPLPNAGGAAVVRTAFDDRGNAVEVASFGVDGRPVMVTAGRATIRYRFDDRDDEIERASFGVDGARVVDRDGCAIERAKFDERGKEIERACLGIDEKPRLSPEGWAVVRSKVDERGKPIEKAYFGVDDLPALHRDGYAAVRIAYDDRGNESARTTLGKDGAPALNAEGFAIWRGKSDERGRVIEEACFGPDGSPVLRKGGYAAFRARYDDLGKLVEKVYLDLGGRPVAAPPADAAP
jgi:tRNA A-37 threonylcarbamoyl transferase component Bud32